MGKGHTSSSSTDGKSSSHSSSQTSSQRTMKQQTEERLTREQRDLMRRRRNVQSAKRSREKKNQEHRWVQLQVLENEDRIRYLESQVDSLTAELTSPPKKTNRNQHSKHSDKPLKQGDRPEWFGDPF